MAEQLREQHGFYYNEQQRIPRRSTATSEDLAQRQTQAGSALPTRTRQPKDDDRDSSYPMKPMVRRLDRAPLTTKQEYMIPLTDGTAMYVTERQLVTMGQEYQDAAQLVTPQIAALRPRRQPNPKLPVQDDTVYEMPPPRTHASETDALPQQKHRRFRFHWLFWLGIAMFIMIAGYILFNMVANWWQVTQDDWHYGRPRTFQTNANVGHGTAANPYSHFIALNLNRHIEVIEIPGSDPAHSKIYLGPTLIGAGEELAPVTLSFEDMNHDGRPDLVIHVGDSKVIFLNQQDGAFKAAPNQ